MKQNLLILLMSLQVLSVQAQDSSFHKPTIHGQTTIVFQDKLPFTAKYTGTNSLLPAHEDQSTLTTTLFAGFRLWKYASVYVTPEVAGGSGLSGALGAGDAFNGESFRIGDPAPAIYLARMYVQQLFPLTKKKIFQEDDQNQLQEFIPEKYISLTVGKIGISDFFDDNQYSHDPRTQFLSWTLMSSGAWDYPANTRRYTPSVIVEYVTPDDEIHGAISLMPKEANGPDMNWKIDKVHSFSLEYTHYYRGLFSQHGTVRLLGFYTVANMGNYEEAIAMNPSAPNITADEKNGRTKYGA